jgi:hypothetical protein
MGIGINEKAHRDIQNFVNMLDDSEDMTDEDEKSHSSGSDTSIKKA